MLRLFTSSGNHRSVLEGDGVRHGPTERVQLTSNEITSSSAVEVSVGAGAGGSIWKASDKICATEKG